ncbi:hypothetical protein [Burkholderia sp. Ac-20353]|uniref:hypothetical protein n=1 Tax=Burkholderia sp. Ac-20353 TaxID=2703894 RepID=UPI00197BB96C|nr:hypothetical protein [Burkholderia sp. Ac-20353]MBN3787573.1 hypothetical protein [Burkholderia sp. Ac-20353]
MKRLSFAVLGFVWGLLITWATVYILNQIRWPEVKSHATGCNDAEHCASHAKFLLGMLATLLWPAIAFAALNVVVFKRWSGRRWGFAFFVLTLFSVLFYLAPYVTPYLGQVA